MFDEKKVAAAHAATYEALLTIDVSHEAATQAADAICKALVEMPYEDFKLELKKELAKAKQTVPPH